MKKNYLLFFSLLGLVIGTNVYSQKTFNVNSGSWATATNWTPNGVPAATDEVIFPATVTSVTNVPNASIDSLTILGTSGTIAMTTANSGDRLTITSSFSLLAGRTLTIGNGNRLNMTFASTCTATIAGTLTIYSGTTDRDITNNGHLNITSAGLITENGASIFNLSAGATLRIGSTDGIVTPAGGAVGNVRTSTRNFNVGANYEYNGTANQNTGTGFPTNLTGILTINNPGNTVTLNADRTIANGGDVILENGTFAIAVGGNDLTMATTSEISRAGGSMTGNLLGAGTYNVNYWGSSKTTGSEISGSGLNNITISLTAGQTVTLNQAKTIPGTLTLTSGILNIGTNTLTLTNGTDGSQISGGSASSYVIATGAGRLFRDNLANAVVHSFPVGTSSYYLPVSVNPATGTTNDFAVNVFQGVTYNATEGGTAMNPKTGIVDAVWNVDRSSGSGNATITLNWDAALEGSNFAAWPDSYIGISRYAGGWQVSSGTGNNTTNTASGTFGSFSPFGVGLSGAALPVKITSIKATEKQGGIQVDWTADTEENLDKYEIGRSSDGVTFTVIGQQIARNSSTESKYSYFDAAPLPGVSFYRLRSVDFGGTKSSYSSIVRVSLDKSDKDILVYPNPVRSGTIAFQSSDLAKGNYTAAVFNAGGQRVFSMEVQHNGGYINQTIYLPSSVKAGMYTLQVTKETEKILSRIFIVQ